MRTVFGIVCLVFVVSGLAYGQASNCPNIEVNGPSGVVDIGKKATYTVQVGSGEWNSQISYVWTVSNGTISAGQGTRSIDFVVENALTVTVEIKIKGLPEGCPNQVSYSLAADDRVRAVKLDEFTGSLDKVDKGRFAEVVGAARADPNSQLYVISSGGAKNPAVSISRKRVVIIDQIVNKLHDYRVTFVNSKENDDRVVIWLVPAGAENPTIDR